MQQDATKQKAQEAADKLLAAQKKTLELMQSSKLQPKHIEEKKVQ